MDQNGDDLEFENEDRSDRHRSDKSGRKSARDKLMDYLARRDHSELELRRKLSPHYPPDEVNAAIEFARESKWLADPEELAGRVAEQLGRRHKGARYIQQFLRNKGLPTVSKNLAEELVKARELIATKLQLEPPYEFETHAKIARLLRNRGFDDETIRKTIHEKP